MHSFQQDIRKTLTQYALIPVLAIAMLGTLLGLWSWQHDVAERSVQVSATAADVLNSLLKDYSNRLDYVVENEDFYNLQQDSEHRRAVYEWLYHEVNITHDNTLFYLLDPQGRVLLSNRKNLPAYLEDTPMNWGIWQRLRKQPNKALAEFSPRMDNKNSDLLLGRAVLRQGELKGYWIFVIRGEYIVNAINSPYMDFALVNNFGYASIATNQVLQDKQFQTLPKQILGKDKQIANVNDEDFYITSTKLATGDFYLYSTMSVSALEERYQLAVGILLLVLLFMIPALIFRVRKESLNRVKAADDLIAAFRALKHGDLESKLKLEGQDFEVVVTSYNHMVNSLQKLMLQNEARAKANAVSEIRQLEAQFHPHFIFNTLENIKFMIKLNPEAAMKMIVDLSTILRYGINNLVQQVTLAEDWQYTTRYLEIMQYRFGKRLQCRFNINVDMDKVLIPKLIFQPILENAIKYGEGEDGTISIGLKVKRVEDRLLIQVTNGGPAIPVEQMAELQKLLHGTDNPTIHTGIYNVHRRLRLIYGKKYGRSITTPKSGGTVVKLNLPYIGTNEDAAANKRNDEYVWR